MKQELGITFYAGLSNTSRIGTAFLFETQDGEFVRFTNREEFLAAVEADKKLQK